MISYNSGHIYDSKLPLLFVVKDLPFFKLFVKMD